MNIPLPPRRRGLLEEMLPLINVVFLLIMFFLLTGQVTPGTAGAAAAPTVALGSDGARAVAASAVTLDGQGRLHWDGTAISDAELVPHAIDWARRHPRDTLTVQADAHTSADRVVQVFTTLQGAGVGQVRLLARGAR